MVASLAFGGMAMTSPYHDAPGAKGPDGTSQEAAAAIQPSVTRLRRLALRTLGQLGAATELEVVPVAGVTSESLQPRFSELRAIGLVEATGARRRNPSGKIAAVLRLTDEKRGGAMIDAVPQLLAAMHAAGIRLVEPIAHQLASGNPVRFRA